MGCGCGGNGSGGGCGGGASHSSPKEHQQLDEQAIAQAVQSFAEQAGQALPEEPSAPLLIASSEQEWPRIRVNGVELPGEAIARELQYHPAASREEAVFFASQALVIRELLKQRAAQLGIAINAESETASEEATLGALLEREVAMPQADEAACRQYFESNRAHFASAPLLAARHILLACPPDDVEERSLAQEQAQALIEQLQAQPERFAELALAHSDCPSKEQGGALGQISQGQTVPEFEKQLFRLPVGLASSPVESRYGLHLVMVDQRIDGQQLPFEAVHQRIANELDQRVWQVAVAQYLKNLVGEADIQGILLDGADSPLVQ